MSNSDSLFFGAVAFFGLIGLTVGYMFVIQSGVPESQGTPGVEPAQGAQEVSVNLENFRYGPNPLKVKAGQAIRFTVTRQDEEGCGNSLQFYGTKIGKYLPLKQPVTFELPALSSGQKYDFGCSMRMVTGQIVA